MSLSTIRNIWALFGVIWFVIFFLLTFAKEMTEPLVILVVISLYAGLILAAFTVLYLAYIALQKVRRRVNKHPACSLLSKSSHQDCNEKRKGLKSEGTAFPRGNLIYFSY